MLDNTMLDKILKYQEIDSEIIKLENVLVDSKARKTVNKTVKSIKDAQNKSLKLEESAKTIIDEYNKLQSVFDDNLKKAQILSKRDTKDLSQENLKVFLAQVSAINKNLSIIDKKLSGYKRNTEYILNEFEKSKKDIMQCRNIYRKSKENFEKLSAEKQPLIEKNKKQLALLEKGIDKEILKKYKALRQDKIFPVLVRLGEHNTCTACGIEIPTAKLSKLKQDGTMACENCRRLIYQR